MGGNKSLIDISGLENVTSISGDLSILTNDVLSICEIESICSYLANPNGEINISGNAPGCNSQEEVADSCETVSIDEFGVQSLEFGVSCHPNPFSTSTTLEFELTQPGRIVVKIFNQLGELIELIQKTAQTGKQTITWDANALPSGVYFVRLQIGNELITKKMIKLK